MPSLWPWTMTNRGARNELVHNMRFIFALLRSCCRPARTVLDSIKLRSSGIFILFNASGSQSTSCFRGGTLVPGRTTPSFKTPKPAWNPLLSNRIALQANVARRLGQRQLTTSSIAIFVSLFAMCSPWLHLRLCASIGTKVGFHSDLAKWTLRPLGIVS